MLKTSDGATPESVTFNSKEVYRVVFNGDEVWVKYNGAETWVLNENIAETMGSFADFDVTFKADGILFTNINIANSGAEKLLRYDTINAYSAAQNKWATENYRTLVFDNAPLGALRDWLTKNGVKNA